VLCQTFQVSKTWKVFVPPKTDSPADKLRLSLQRDVVMLAATYLNHQTHPPTLGSGNYCKNTEINNGADINYGI
jgi:hypothetical protein